MLSAARPNTGRWAAADWKVGCLIGMLLLGFQRCSDIITRTLRRHWHMILLSIIARHSTQSVTDSSSRKFREKDATGSRKKCLGYKQLNSAKWALHWADSVDSNVSSSAFTCKLITIMTIISILVTTIKRTCPWFSCQSSLLSRKFEHRSAYHTDACLIAWTGTSYAHAKQECICTCIFSQFNS